MNITTEQLVAQLKELNAEKRFSAIMELMSFRLSPSEETDVEITRSDAIKELKQLRVSLATEPLIDVLLHDSEKMNRSMAARALGDYGEPRAIEPLRKCLDESDFEILCSAIKALGQLKDEGSAPRFLSFLDKSYDKWVRVEAIGALCRLPYLPAQTIFRQMLKDPDRLIRYEAMQGLVKLNNHKRSEVKADLVMVLSDPDETNRRLAQQWLEIIEKEEKEEKS